MSENRIIGKRGMPGKRKRRIEQNKRKLNLNFRAEMMKKAHPAAALFPAVSLGGIRGFAKNRARKTGRVSAGGCETPSGCDWTFFGVSAPENLPPGSPAPARRQGGKANARADGATRAFGRKQGREESQRISRSTRLRSASTIIVMSSSSVVFAFQPSTFSAFAGLPSRSSTSAGR